MTGLLFRAKISPMTRRAAHETIETEPRCRIQVTGGARGFAGGGEQTLAELAQKYDVHATQTACLEERAVAGGSECL